MGNRNSYTSLKETSEGEDEKLQSKKYAEDTKEKEPIRPSIFSWITMSWIGGIIHLGNKRPLENNDLSPIDGVFSSEETIKMLEKAWNEEIRSSVSENNREPKLWRALLNMHSPFTYIWVVLLNLCTVLMSVVQPIFLSFILSHLMIYGVDERIYMVYIYILLIFLLVIFMAITETFYIKNACSLSVHFRSSLVGLTLKKVSRILAFYMLFYHF